MVTKLITYLHCNGKSRLASCSICGKGFKYGETIVTKMASRAKKKRYHIKCAEAKNIL